MTAHPLAPDDELLLGFDDHPFLLPSRMTPTSAGDLELAQAFRDAFGRHPAGTAIITGDRPTGPVGVLVSSLASVSAIPAVVSFSVSDASNAGRALLDCDRVAVHLLTAGDQPLGALFAARSGQRSTADVWQWEAGLPVLQTHGAILLGRIRTRVRAGSATLVAVDLDTALKSSTSSSGLVYFNRGWHVVDD